MKLKPEQILIGIRLSVKALYKSVQNKKIQRYFYKAFLFLSISKSVFYILFNSLFYLLNCLLMYLFNFDINQFILNYSSIVFINNLFILRYIYPYPMNNIFLSNLKLYGKNTELVEYLVNNSDYKLDYYLELKQGLLRNLKRMAYFGLLFLVSKIPVVGPLILPLNLFLLFNRMLGFKLALLITLIPTFFNSNQNYCLLIIKFYYTSRSIIRELFEPYFNRLEMDQKQRALFFKKKFSITFGFSILFYFLMLIPFFGPAFYIMAQASIVILLNYFVDNYDHQSIMPIPTSKEL